MKKPNWIVWLENKKECEKWNNFYLKKKILRKQRLRPKDYFKKALHNLDFANWIYEKHKNEIKKLFGKQRFFDWVIVIYYYAIYHAALALIASKNLFSKSHLATLNALILYFYHEKKIEKEDVEVVVESISKALEREDIEDIVETKELRERASYEPGYEFEESLVEIAKLNATRFIERVREILEI
ncbi:MAG: hypothetical protein QXG91_04975 [Candidatus Aenigmatarchaeota archaeon]